MAGFLEPGPRRGVMDTDTAPCLRWNPTLKYLHLGFQACIDVCCANLGVKVWNGLDNFGKAFDDRNFPTCTRNMYK